MKMDIEKEDIMSLKDLNKRAEQTFDAIKQRKGWTDRIIKEAARDNPEIDTNKIQKMLNTPPIRMEVEDTVKHHDEKFTSGLVTPLAFIDGLELPANLSIAIACLIDYKNKGSRDKKILANAMEWIEKEIMNG